MKITLIGTAYPYRGGLALYNERLMEEFQKQSNEVSINTFTLQYPSFLFPGETQFATWEKPNKFPIKRTVNSINPFNWIKTGRSIKKQRPDIVIIKYWLPFFSPCFSIMSKIIKSNHHTKVITIVDNIIPHEKRRFDTTLTNMFVRNMDGFVAMSKSVFDEITKFNVMKPRVLCPHPLFDNFGESIKKEDAQKTLNLNPDDINLLFFGLIRGYKGLDILIEAMSDERLKEFPVKLLVAGEFYDDSKRYYDRVKELSLEERIRFDARFIPDSEVKNYFCATDLVVQPYKSATQSGVTQIGYHFEKPMLVTNVGGLAEIIPNKKVGYVVEPKAQSIANAIIDFCINRPDFSEGIKQEKKKYSWENMTQAIEKIYKQL
ncbi:MAG: glycosyltransferase [Bacteroidales bacterium]|jgi:glycosyltransferase involved in cell wall biosynthesis|nr:glycosyltransferase [Bacteroidales bacterium]MDD4001376.1 glycosyltransferase [Bacteroidales bacterium]MDD4529204.1 glycosyltransferase [Bacteroidales bacterium]MDD4829398.1 glycosyltransferase [Bacteroidales bacterium]